MQENTPRENFSIVRLAVLPQVGQRALLSALLAATVSTWFLLLTAFVGVNQWAFVVLGVCPASLVLRRFGVTPQCRW